MGVSLNKRIHILLNTLTEFEKKLFTKFIKIRFVILLWVMLGVLGTYLIFYYFGGLSVIWIDNITTKNRVEKIQADYELRMKPKYRKLQTTVKEQSTQLQDIKFKLYQKELHMRIYEYYRNYSMFEKWSWVTDNLLDNIYNYSIKWKKLNPSFNRVYFESFPEDEITIEKYVRKKYPGVENVKELDILMTKEKNDYCDLIFPLVDYSRCRKESNFDKNCISYNYLKDKKGNFILDKTNNKIIISVDEGIEQMNRCLKTHNMLEIEKAANKKQYDICCTQFAIDAELFYLAPELRARNVFDLEKNIAMRIRHAEHLMNRGDLWCLVNWEFFAVCKKVMLKNYYPEFL